MFLLQDYSVFASSKTGGAVLACPLKFYRLQYVISDTGVSLDQTELYIGYPTGLTENLTRYRDLANVMNQPGHTDSINLSL